MSARACAMSPIAAARLQSELCNHRGDPVRSSGYERPTKHRELPFPSHATSAPTSSASRRSRRPNSPWRSSCSRRQYCSALANICTAPRRNAGVRNQKNLSGQGDIIKFGCLFRRFSRCYGLAMAGEYSDQGVGTLSSIKRSSAAVRDIPRLQTFGERNSTKISRAPPAILARRAGVAPGRATLYAKCSYGEAP